jgi:hypothetical protein
MKDRRVQLKVKIKSLAAEARIIRNEENKGKDRLLKDDLTNHRKGIVRTEARYALLAYAFITGRKYRSQEANPRIKPSWEKVRNQAVRFGVCYDYDNEESREYTDRKKAEAERFEAWLKEAQE